MRTFTMSDKEEQEFEEWYKEHKCKWKKKNKSRWITFSFTPTGLGDSITVMCSCGKIIEITDTENW